MASTFPSILTSYTNPNPTDRLNSPSHSGIETNQNSGVSQLEAVIGVEGASSVVGTFQYLVRSPASDGGGHVQTANRGGTGQTSFNKGDILVATSSSVLTKLSIGDDGFALLASSVASTGISWQPFSRTTVQSSVISSILVNTTSETSIFSVSLPGSILGTNRVVKAKVFIVQYGRAGGTFPTVTVRANYGGDIASIVVPKLDVNGIIGELNYTLIGAGSTSRQRGILRGDFVSPAGATASVYGVTVQTIGTSSVNSNANATLGMTAQWSAADPSNAITYDSWIIDNTT